MSKRKKCIRYSLNNDKKKPRYVTISFKFASENNINDILELQFRKNLTYICLYVYLFLPQTRIRKIQLYNILKMPLKFNKWSKNIFKKVSNHSE